MIALVFSLVVNERRREIGLLRAMGARCGVVFRLILGEALALTGVGGVLGVLASGVLLVSFQGLIEKRLRVPFLLPDCAGGRRADRGDAPARPGVRARGRVPARLPHQSHGPL